MKKVICLLLTVWITMSICACTNQTATVMNGEATTTDSVSDPTSGAGAASSEETVSDAVPNHTQGSTHPAESKPAESSEPNEATGPGSDGVLSDKNGNVILSDLPTYAEILALHEYDPDRYRDPGELQPETQEMIRLEDGQWYQSFVYSTYNCRCIFLSSSEAEMDAAWDFLPIGSAKNAFLYNVGARYDDPSGMAQYVARPIAVRGTLAEGPDGYAYQLRLPDELIVCVERETSDGTCDIMTTDTLAIPNSAALLVAGFICIDRVPLDSSDDTSDTASTDSQAISEVIASLLADIQREVVVTGVVMRDENGIFYLKDVAPFDK